MYMTLDLLITNIEMYSYQNSNKQFIHHPQTNIGVKDGKIAFIGSLNSEITAKQVFSGQGLTAFPGFIDSQVHFREPGLTHKEDLETGTRAALAGGVTSVFEMPNTNPATTCAKSFNNKLLRAQGRIWCHIGFFIGATSENISELATLEKHKNCAGIKVFMGSSTGHLLVDQQENLEKIFQMGKRRIIVHAEDEARLKSRKHLATDVSKHAVWRDEETALLATKTAVALAKKYQRPVHVLHISSSEEMQFLKNEKQNLKTSGLISVEILPQYLLLSAPSCYEKLGTLAQQNPPIRDQRHLPVLWQSVTDGTVDVMGSDHAPHTLVEKNKPYPQSPSGVPGVQTMVPLMLNEIANGNLGLQKLVDLLCENPREIFGCKNKGRIDIGMDADITLVDLKSERRIENDWIKSRCGWTPFAGKTVKGWPQAVFLKGQLAMHKDELVNDPSGPKGELVEFDV